MPTRTNVTTEVRARDRQAGSCAAEFRSHRQGDVGNSVSLTLEREDRTKESEEMERPAEPSRRGRCVKTEGEDEGGTQSASEETTGGCETGSRKDDQSSLSENGRRRRRDAHKNTGRSQVIGED